MAADHDLRGLEPHDQPEADADLPSCDEITWLGIGNWFDAVA